MSDLVISTNVDTLLQSSSYGDFRTNLDVYSKSEVDAKIPTSVLPDVGPATFTGDLLVTGNLTVNGNTITDTITLNTIYGDEAHFNGLQFLANDTHFGLTVKSLTTAQTALISPFPPALPGILYYNVDEDSLKLSVTTSGGTIWKGLGGVSEIITSDLVITAEHEGKEFFCDTTAGDILITFLATLTHSMKYTFTKIDATANKITFSHDVSGDPAFELNAQYESVVIMKAPNGLHYVIG